MRHASMFSGIGGFDLGLQRCGFKTVWANDNDKYACQVYRKNLDGSVLVEGDIREVDAKTVPDHDLLSAGFPCQTFSLAGKRKGINESRGTLFYHIYRVAKVKRPKLLLLENVKGLLSNESGRTFATIIRLLEGLGYLIEWQVLNSKHFGVPQNRERVFIVGHLRGEPRRQIFPIGEATESVAESCGEAQGEGSWVRNANSLNCPGSGKERNLIYRHPRFNDRQCLFNETDCYPSLRDSQRPPAPKPIAYALSHSDGKDGSENLIMLSHTKANIKQRRQQRETTWTLDGTSQKQGIISKTIRAEHHNSTNAPMTITDQRIRRLTPIECERLQGFPDNYTQGVSDTQRYKLLGNAVTVNVIEFLGTKLKEALA